MDEQGKTAGAQTRHGEVARHTDAPSPTGRLQPSRFPDAVQLLAHAPTYALLRLPQDFPHCAKGSDLDILCADAAAVEQHLRIAAAIDPYQRFHIRTTIENGHRHVDFVDPSSGELLLRFDLIEAFEYQSATVSRELGTIILESRQECLRYDKPIWTASLEHESAIRFLEYTEYRDIRPEKIKHVRFIEQSGDLRFVDVLNRFTDLTLELRPTSSGQQHISVTRQPIRTVTPPKEPRKGPRMDSFIIWGHGCKDERLIAALIREHPNFRPVFVKRMPISDMRSFVQMVYACDAVPLHHLEAKTQYLLNTPPEILFMLVKNLEPDERFFGEGEYRHIQCAKVKQLKEQIRDFFNPRVHDKRTEDHVIHITDYEAQTCYLLEMLGLPGLEFFTRIPHPDFDLPYHVAPFAKYELREVDTSSLIASLVGGRATPITETPHFHYVAGNARPYQEYMDRHFARELTDDHLPRAFDKLIRNFDYGRGDDQDKRSYILVQETQAGQHLIIDGLHRAAILAHQGVPRITVLVGTWQ